MDGSEVVAIVLRPSACAECQRRKQKCNRQWPCNHCRKRRVAERCLYNGPKPGQDKGKDKENENGKLPISLDRTCSHNSEDFNDSDDDYYDNDDGSDWIEEGQEWQLLGYMDGPLLASFGINLQRHHRSFTELDYKLPEDCPPLKAALDALPPRAQMDYLLQFFFNYVNNHYYIIYPSKFLNEYHTWWDERKHRRPLSIQWTALLTILCAAVTQHTHTDSQPWAKPGQGATVDSLTSCYHQLGRALAHAIPAGRYHLLNIQRILHSIYWYTAEARFVEAWHDIGIAVREAQELGLHKNSASDGLPDFEREMRRRVWCILMSWDWQLASELCRPTLIDYTDVDAEQPTLNLENLYPSPLLHMKLQSEVIVRLAARFGTPKNIRTPAEIRQYKEILEQWIESFPAVYGFNRPGLSHDSMHPWVMHHRYYLHTMAYLMILNPMRTYMVKAHTSDSPEDDIWIRNDGVRYSLQTIDTTTQWASYAYHRNGHFNFIIFSLFDTVSVLAAAIMKDEEGAIPRRDEILLSVMSTLALLRALLPTSKMAKTSYNILCKIVRRLRRLEISRDHKRLKSNDVPAITSCPPQTNSPDTININPLSSQHSSDATPPIIFNKPVSLSPRFAAALSMHGMTPESAVSGSVYDDTIPYTPPQFMPVGPYSHSELVSESPMQLMPVNFVGAPQRAEQQQCVTPVFAQDSVAAKVIEPIMYSELGDFGSLWNWQSLNLDFIVPDAV